MIVVKTQAGQLVMKNRSVPMSPRQRAAFILIDGNRTLEQVLAATAAAGVTQDDIDQLFTLGLIEETQGKAPGFTNAAAQAAQLQAKRNSRTMEQRYADAHPIAMRLTASLGLRGFRLINAVEAATTYMDLLALAPRIREALGEERFAPLDAALND